MLTLALIIIVAWFIGLIAHIAGVFINLLLVAAAILLIAYFIEGRTRHV